MPRHHRPPATPRRLVVALTLAACAPEGDRGEGASAPPPDMAATTAAVVTSDLTAGPMLPRPASGMPFDASPEVIAEGYRLYQWMNCAGCHGLRGGGGMGPPFADGRWIYGSEPENIFQSIVQGRPDGMPSFRALQAEQVWQLVAYVRSLGPTESSAPSSDYSAGSGQGAPSGGRERRR